MSIEAVKSVAKFISHVAMYFPKPRFGDEEVDETVWQTSLTKILGHYGDQVLTRAAENIVRTRDRKKDGAYFPVPSECIAACEKAKQAIDLESRPLIEAVTPKPDQFSPERHQLALDLMKTGIGQAASREGWHGSLYDFAYAKARLPNGAEIERLKAESEAFRKVLSACERGDGGPFSRPLAQLGKNIARRRDGYRNEVKS